jgi:hypothetical protein
MIDLGQLAVGRIDFPSRDRWHLFASFAANFSDTVQNVF